jgi:hypothetical protein
MMDKPADAVDNPTTIAASPAAASVVKNQLQPEDAAIHSWYRFVLGYPPHLVREYVQRLGADPERDWVCDPFCGTATTPVEARLHGFTTISTDANPIALLATHVKLAWDIDLEVVRCRLDDVLELAEACLDHVGLANQSDNLQQLTLFSPQRVRRTTPTIQRYVEQFNPDELLPPTVAALIPKGLTTAGNFIIIYFSHETLGLGSSAGDQLYHCLAVVSGGEAPCPCPPIAYWDNPRRSASPRRHHGALRPRVLR